MQDKPRSPREYLEAVSEFIAFLSGKDLALEEILSHMVLVVFAPLNAEAITLRQVNSKNQAVRIGTWGMPLEMLQPQGDIYDLNEKYPSTDTLRNRRTTWINTLPDFGDEYPLLKAFPYTTGAKSVIFFPIERIGTPVAALGIFCRDKISPNAEIESFLTAIGSVFSMYLFNQDSKAQDLLKAVGQLSTSSSLTLNELTERQLIILRLISEERTNHTISELLGYSESTVRQETIKIFAKLNCAGRKEAAQIYREQLAESKEL